MEAQEKAMDAEVSRVNTEIKLWRGQNKVIRGERSFQDGRKGAEGNIYLEAMLPPQVVMKRKILKQCYTRAVLFFLHLCYSYPLLLIFIKRINLSS